MKSGENKFILGMILTVAVMLISVSFISANSVGASIGGPRTLVDGVIYYADSGNPAEGAKVTVVCEDNNHVRHSVTKKTTSLSDGTYFAVFDQKLECNEDDIVTVSATDGALTGMKTGIVHNGVIGSLDVAVVNVPLVPEFGVTAGIVTVLGAVGTFFVIRRKHHIRIKRKL